MCAMAAGGFVRPTQRLFHSIGMRQTQPQGLVAEIFSESPYPTPDSINKVMNMIHADSPYDNVTPFRLCYRSIKGRSAIKGLRIGTKEEVAPRGRSVVIVSGVHVAERVSIAVNLYVAAALSRRPLDGVDVSIFPIMKPMEYEARWHAEQVFKAKELLTPTCPNSHLKVFPEEQNDPVITGLLRSYAMKRSTNFINVEMDLNTAGTMLNVTHNSLARSSKRAGLYMSSVEQSSPLGAIGDSALFGAFVAPPSIVLELRDRNNGLDEEDVAICGEEVLSAVQKLLVDTSIPRGFVL